jgi:hypothetical protein
LWIATGKYIQEEAVNTGVMVTEPVTMLEPTALVAVRVTV